MGNVEWGASEGRGAAGPLVRGVQCLDTSYGSDHTCLAPTLFASLQGKVMGWEDTARGCRMLKADSQS